MKSAKIALTALFVIALAAVLCLAYSGKVDDIYTISYKTAVQLLVVALTGHVVTFLVAKLNYEREELRAKDQFRRDMISKLNEGFIEIKKIRRTVRAGNTPADGGYPQEILVEGYNDAMEQINEVQLRLEVLAKEVESFQGLFAEYGVLKEKLDSLEEYLNGIVDEFEHTSPVQNGKPPRFGLGTLPEVSDLLGPYKPSSFRTRFVKPYYEALDLIRGELLYSGDNLSTKRRVRTDAAA